MGKGSGEAAAMDVGEDTIKLADGVDSAIDETTKMVAESKENLTAAVDKLLALERVHRLANHAPETAVVCVQIVKLCFQAGDWEALQTNITLLCKRRAQLKQAVTKLIQQACEYIDKAPDEKTKLEYLTTLRTVSEGKIFVELERARITKTIAEIREKNGDIDGAAEIMQDMQVETYGTMDRREKTEFILEQVRLCLARKDYIRAGIMSKKVTSRTLATKELEDLILRYYELVIQIKLHSLDYLEVCRSYLSRCELLEDKADDGPYLNQLSLAILFLVLSKRDPMQQDLLHRVAAYKTVEKLPVYRALLKLFTTEEIIHRDHLQEQYGAEIKTLVESAKYEEPLDWETPMHDRTIEHNLRVISQYYSRLRLKRLAELLSLSEVDTEERVTRMVSDEKAIWARIDRPAGILVFAKPNSVDTVLNEWAGSVSKLLDIVERTCHLVHKENMIHGIEA